MEVFVVQTVLDYEPGVRARADHGIFSSLEKAMVAYNAEAFYADDSVDPYVKIYKATVDSDAMWVDVTPSRG